MLSPDIVKRLKNATDALAVRDVLVELRQKGWLENGRLRGIKLENASLERMDLQGADLRKGRLAGTALRRADLRCARLDEADLTGCDFGEADLRDADLFGASLEGANLKGARVQDFQLVLTASLVAATLPDGRRYDGRFQLQGDLAAARGEKVYPDQAEAMARWYGVSTTDYDAGQVWADEYLEELIGDAQVAREADRAWVRDARRSGMLENGSLEAEDLTEFNLSGCDLTGARLTRVTLDEAMLVRTILNGADLEGASLVNADLSHADLAGSKLREADLRDADLGGANLQNADLLDADPFGSDMHDVNLLGAKIGDNQLVWAHALVGATLPDGSRYDGRYNLAGDLDNARAQGIELDDPEQMAAYYDIEVARYEAGQRWAQLNLERLMQDSER